MDFQEIIYSKENRVATITLNRPTKLNAYSEVMVHEIITALSDARDDEQVRACLLYTSPSPRDRQKSRMPSSA